jgi:hypothetical protein
MRSLPELITMVKGMKVAARAVASSLLMVAMLIYVFSIVLHMIISDDACEVGGGYEDKFGSLPKTMWTLLMDGTFMDSTGNTLWPLLERGQSNTYLAVFVFLIFVLLSSMTVMNMLIGILCEVVSAVAQSDRDEIALGLLRDTILMELKAHDDDESGTINRAELERTLRDPHTVSVLTHMDVDIDFLEIFQDMSLPKDDSEIRIESIIEFILTFRGDQACTVKHLIEVQGRNRWYLSKGLNQICRRMESKLAEAQAQVIWVAQAVHSLRGSPLPDGTRMADAIVTTPRESKLADINASVVRAGQAADLPVVGRWTQRWCGVPPEMVEAAANVPGESRLADINTSVVCTEPAVNTLRRSSSFYESQDADADVLQMAELPVESSSADAVQLLAMDHQIMSQPVLRV